LAVVLVSTGSAGCTPASSTGVDNVAILVVDNFNPQPTLPADAKATANCASSHAGTNAQGANEVGGTGAGDGLPPGYSHGRAVFEDLRDALAKLLNGNPSSPLQATELQTYGIGTGAFSNTGVLADYTAKWKYDPNDGKGARDVVLLGVDTNNFDTGVINTRLASLVNMFSGNTSGNHPAKPIRRVVVNMSFVIAPCDVQEWLRGKGELTDDQWLASYRAVVDTEPDLVDLRGTIDDLTGAGGLRTVLSDARFAKVTQRVNVEVFYRSFIDNPQAENPSEVKLSDTATRVKEGTGTPTTLADKAYLQILTDPLNDRTNGFASVQRTYPVRVVLVGAAGNGITMPTTDPKRPRHFHFTFPFAPAIWQNVISISASTPDGGALTTYSNGGEVMLPGDYDIGESHAHGTSFAAPRMAAQEAIYLLTGGQVPCDNETPPLGYAKDTVLNSSGWQANWKNKTFDEAIRDTCPSFKPQTTLVTP
jgi:hypothetical protein